MHCSLRRSRAQRLVLSPTKMWRIPLQAKVTDLKRHTLILDGPNGTESINPLYEVPSCARTLKQIEILKKYIPSPSEAINNVCELPSIEPAIRYLHHEAGFPTKATWLKAIRNGSYLSWPLVNIKNINKYFPESEETQKGHMRTQRQGVRSTKNHRPAKAQILDDAKPTEELRQTPILKNKDIFIEIYSPKKNVH